MATTFNEFPKWALTRAFTLDRNTVDIFFFSHDTNIVVTSIKKRAQQNRNLDVGLH